MNKNTFALTPIEDWIIVKMIDVPTKEDVIRSKLGIVGADGTPPKNIMELERKKAQDIVTYEDAKNVLLDKYDSKHPWQGVVMAMGPGRMISETERIGMPDLVPGNRIYMRGRVGEPVVVNKELYFMIKPHEIYGVVKNTE